MRQVFVYRHVASTDMFLDGPEAKARDAVRVLYANETVRSVDVARTPDINESEPAAGFRVIGLEGLVSMKLVAYRDKDRVHIRDLASVGLIDETWPARFIPELGARLQAILDNPDG